MAVTDFIPHGLVTALAGVVTYVFNSHVKTDAERFKVLTESNDVMDAKLVDISERIAMNHAEILKLFIDAGQHAATNAAIAAAAVERADKR